MDISDTLAELSAERPRVRERSAAELGDLLRGNALDEATTHEAVAHLVARVGAEPRYYVLEQVLHAIDETFVVLPLALVAPIADHMPTLDADPLEYSLNILATTYDQAAIPMITPYLGHSVRRIRIAAAEALNELR